MSDLSKFLANAAKNWDDTVETAKSSGFEDPPDGQYIVKMSGAEVAMSKQDKAMVKWSFTILEGDLAGKTKYDFMSLEGKLELQPLAWRLQSLGIRLEDVDVANLQDELNELVEQAPAMRITLQTKGEFQNLKITRLLPNYEIPDDDDEEAVELQVGMQVTFKEGRKNLTGEVSEIDVEEGEATVDVDGEPHVVPFEKLSIILEGKDE